MTQLDFAAYEQQFYLTLAEQPEFLYREDLARLTQIERAQALVECYRPMIKGRSLDAACTYFASWFGRVCGAYQYALWHDNAVLDLSLPNLTLQIVDHPVGKKFVYAMKQANVLQLSEEERKNGIAALLENFYGNQVRPLLESVAAAGGLNPGMLWGQLATYLYYMRDAWLEMEGTAAQKERLDADLRLLFHQLRPEVFGRPKNPFDLRFRMLENPRKPETQMRVKASCCLALKRRPAMGIVTPARGQRKRNGPKSASGCADSPDGSCSNSPIFC